LMKTNSQPSSMRCRKSTISRLGMRSKNNLFFYWIWMSSKKNNYEKWRYLHATELKVIFVIKLFERTRTVRYCRRLVLLQGQNYRTKYTAYFCSSFWYLLHFPIEWDLGVS
jgi:hypothetical protein